MDHNIKKSSKQRIDRGKVARGGAPVRNFPSRGATYLVDNHLIPPGRPKVTNEERTLDYGCGHGLDAETYGWESYDPYYNPVKLKGGFDTIVCTNVLNTVSKLFRIEIVESMRGLLKETGIAYIIVPRNIPIKGRYSGFHRRPQYHVVLSLDSIYKDDLFEIYLFKKDSIYVDKTLDNL